MTTTREEFEAWITSETNVREDAVWHEDKQRYTLLSRKQANWELWKAAHLAGQRAMQTRAGEVANKIAERILAANTHRGRTSSAGSFASGVAEDIGCDIRALEVKPS